MSFEPEPLTFEPREEGVVTVRLCRRGVSSCARADYSLMQGQDVGLEASVSDGFAFVEVGTADGVTIENGVATLVFGEGRKEIHITVEVVPGNVREGRLVWLCW